MIESNFLLDLRLKISETTATAATSTVKIMKSQAGLIIHAKMAKITARVIVTIGKIRLKRSLFAELSTGLGTVPNPLAVGIDAFSNMLESNCGVGC